MTPRQLHALRKLRLEQMQREEYLVGVIAAEVANGSFNRREKSMAAEDFMIHPLKVKTAAGDAFLAQLAKLPGATQVDKL